MASLLLHAYRNRAFPRSAVYRFPGRPGCIRRVDRGNARSTGPGRRDAWGSSPYSYRDWPPAAGEHDAVKRDAQVVVALQRLNDCLTDPYRGTEWCHGLGQNDGKLPLLGVELEHVCCHPAPHCSDTPLKPADDLMHRESVGDTELQEDLCIISIEVKVNAMFPQQGGQW